MSDSYVIYRDCGRAMSTRGRPKRAAERFVEFLLSSEAARIFSKWGWMTS